MFGNAAGGRTTALALALVVLAGTVTAVPGLVLFAQPAAADPPSTVAVTQGSNCYTVTPVVDESQTVEEFYDYRNPETDPSSRDYSSHGTTEYQESRHSSMFFYTGSDGTSLVVVHDELDGDGNGSTISWDVSGLPADWDMAVRDDYYQNGTQDDDYVLGDTTADVDWKYGPNRTDGAAFRGLDSEEFDTITIDPGYNEDADHWGSWSRSGSDQYRIEGWLLKEEGGETVGELSLDQEVTITAGPCAGDGPTANIDAPDTTGAGEEITFDGSGSTAAADIVSYEWDLGDGTNATEESVTHTYNEPSNYTVTLTVEDDAGNTNTTSTQITVTEPTDEPPTASLSVPPNATVNESVQLDASGSTDDEGIVEYRWDFDSDGTVDRITNTSSTDHQFDTVGEVTVNLTVVDTGGATDSTTATLTVEERTNEPPTADLSAPSNGTVGEDVRFDASGSSDDVEEYRWDFDGDGTVDRTTNASVVQHPFDTAGEFTANVTVVDAEGATDSDTATVSVSESTDLSAAIGASATEVSVNETVTFDGSGSTPADRIVDYRWEFGDGTNDTGATAGHSYDEPGTYTVTLTVNGTGNATASTTTEVTVSEEDDGNDGGDGSDGGNGNDDTDDNGGNSSPPPSSGGGGGGGGGAPPAPDPEPAFELGGVNATAGELVAGEEGEFSIRVENTGDAAGTKEVAFAVDGTTTANETVDLAPGENATVTFTHRFDDPGTHTVELDGAESTEVRVLPAEPDLSVTDVSLADDTVTTEEDVRIDATVRNDGYVEGSMELELELFDEVVAVESVSVPRGEERTVTFTRRVSAPGTYTASVGGQNVTVEVVGTDADGGSTQGEESTTATAAPGFTPLVTLLALLSLVACAVVRSRSGR